MTALEEQLVLFQLTRQACSAKVSEQFLKAPQLAHCRQCVVEAGSELQPDWAGGAWLLTSLSEHQVFSLLEECPGIKLRTYHMQNVQPGHCPREVGS